MMNNLFGNLSRASRRIIGVSLAVLLLLSASPRQREVTAALRQQQDEKALAAQIFFNEGLQLYQQGTAEAKRSAIQKFEKSSSAWRELGERGRQALALGFLGRINSDLGEKQKSLEFYNQALALWRAVRDRRWEAAVLNNIGSVYDALGEKQKALDFYNQSLLIVREFGNHSNEATALNNIGGVYYALGEKQKALSFYNQALSLRRALNDQSGEADTLNNIGTVYDALGEKQRALDFYNQALPLYRAVGDRGGEATTLNNIGAVYSYLGEQQRALELFTQATHLFRAIKDRSNEAMALNNMGRAYHQLGENQKALDFYNQALLLKRAVADRGGEATTLNNISSVYIDLGEKQKAIEFYNQALLLFRTVSDRKNQAVALSNIGRVYGQLGDNRKALDLYNQSLSLFRTVRNRSGESDALSNIGFAERSLGRLNESRVHMEECLKIRESLRTEVVSKELRASYFASIQNDYEFYVDLLMQQHRQEPGKNHHAEALRSSERSRARSFLELLTEARADIKQGVDAALLARERSAQQRLNAKAEAQFKRLAGATSEAQVATIKQETDREIDALTTELQQVQTQIRQASPRYAALTQPQPLSVAEIQQQALDTETLLLEYALGAERSFVWAVTPTGLASYELPKREVIETAAREVYALMTARNLEPKDPETKEPETKEQKQARVAAAERAYPAAAARLSQMLLAPVAQHLGKQRLVIVADGFLHYLPFGALPDPTVKAATWQPLLVEHEVVNLPSASTLAVLRRELKGRAPAAKTLAVIADPVFTRADERFRAGAAPVAKVAARPEPTLRELANAQVVRKLIPSASGDLDIKRLKYTRDEANALLALVPANERMQALDFDATRALVESERLSQYRYVHFATHGLADSERAELSTIVLSLFDAQGRTVDGFLRAHEVFNLNLPAELVALSACETGLGKQVKGEGLVSLTRGFMYAGAARVVVSLWAVNDKATAELMAGFYRKMLNEGQRPAAALRAAQLELWKTKKWQAPYYWAAFTVQGEWR